MRRMRGRRIAAACGLVLIGLAVVASAGWAGLALSYGEPGAPALLRRAGCAVRRAGLQAALDRAAVAALALAPARGVRSGVHRRPGVVARHRALERSRLADRRGPAALCDHRWRPRDDAPRAQLRLPHGDRLHAGLLRQDLRPAPAHGGGPGRRVLDGAGDRAHVPELRVRRHRAPGHLDRDAQEEGRCILDAQGVLSPVRALLRGGRRTRRDPVAHQLPPRILRRRRPASIASTAISTTPAASSSSTCGTSMRSTRGQSSTTR